MILLKVFLSITSYCIYIPAFLYLYFPILFAINLSPIALAQFGVFPSEFFQSASGMAFYGLEHIAIAVLRSFQFFPQENWRL